MPAALARYPARRRRNAMWMGLSVAAAAVGLTGLFMILVVLLWKGFAGLSLAVFTQMTPPPGSAGGLLNAIVGSLIMTVIGVAVGTPLGMLAGTYLAEYGKYSRLAFVVRFINDILLSAPSIVIGLFIYEIVVAPMGHFSAIAGAIALAVLVVPVVVRTTEDMLNLVPNALREAGSALGMPRSMVIQRIGYRAVRAGLMTGVLLAIARVSGETAPLLFTALNNQFFSTNLLKPMSSLPAVIFQFALSPYKDWQQLAWTGALIITLAVLALSIAARALSATTKQQVGSRRVSRMSNDVECPEACQAAGGDEGQGHRARPQFLLWREPCAQGCLPVPVRGPGDGVHRSVGLRQVDAAARAEPHVRPLSGPARRGRGPARRREHPLARPRPQSSALARRHGVPEADAVSDDDLRQHRLRHPPLRKAAQVRNGRPRRIGAASGPRSGAR